MTPWCVTIQMKATDQYIFWVVFIVLYKVVQRKVKVLECPYSYESYPWVVLSCGTIHYIICCTRSAVTYTSVDDTLITVSRFR